MNKYLPNILTLLRILIVPLFIFVLISNIQYSYHYALLMFLIASFTDILDGKLARKFNVESKLGQFLDPLADKILILSTFIAFLVIEPLSGIIESWMVFLIFSRDIFVTLLRVSFTLKGVSLLTSRIAKFKTTSQAISIIIILLFLILDPISFSRGSVLVIEIMMMGVTCFTVYTGIDYYIKNRKLIFSNN